MYPVMRNTCGLCHSGPKHRIFGAHRKVIDGVKAGLRVGFLCVRISASFSSISFFERRNASVQDVHTRSAGGCFARLRRIRKPDGQGRFSFNPCEMWHIKNAHVCCGEALNLLRPHRPRPGAFGDVFARSVSSVYSTGTTPANTEVVGVLMVRMEISSFIHGSSARICVCKRRISARLSALFPQRIDARGNV